MATEYVIQAEPQTTGLESGKPPWQKQKSIVITAICDEARVYVTKEELLKGGCIWTSAEDLVVEDVVKISIKLLPHITDVTRHLPYIANYLEVELLGEALSKHKQENSKYWIVIESTARDIRKEEATEAQRRQVLVTDLHGRHACMFPLCSEEDLEKLKGETVELEYQLIVLPLEPHENIIPGEIKIMGSIDKN